MLSLDRSSPLFIAGVRPREFPAPAGWVAIAPDDRGDGLRRSELVRGASDDDQRPATDHRACWPATRSARCWRRCSTTSSGGREAANACSILRGACSLWLATVPVAFVAIRFGAPLLGVALPAPGRRVDRRHADSGQPRHGVPDAAVRAQSRPHHRRVGSNPDRHGDGLRRDMAFGPAPTLARVDGDPPLVNAQARACQSLSIPCLRTHVRRRSSMHGRYASMLEATLRRLETQAIARDVSPEVAQEARAATARALSRHAGSLERVRRTPRRGVLLGGRQTACSA